MQRLAEEREKARKERQRLADKERIVDLSNQVC